jgi:hypothetical protein
MIESYEMEEVVEVVYALAPGNQTNSDRPVRTLAVIFSAFFASNALAYAENKPYNIRK